jgi:hypothetical protein
MRWNVRYIGSFSAVPAEDIFSNEGERSTGSQFLLAPLLSHREPNCMSVNAAEQLRKALIGSTEKSRYEVMLDELKISSVARQVDDLA